MRRSIRFCARRVSSALEVWQRTRQAPKLPRRSQCRFVVWPLCVVAIMADPTDQSNAQCKGSCPAGLLCAQPATLEAEGAILNRTSLTWPMTSSATVHAVKNFRSWSDHGRLPVRAFLPCRQLSSDGMSRGNSFKCDEIVLPEGLSHLSARLQVFPWLCRSHRVRAWNSR